ncbi:WXG100 family type VII secretion target [Streptomyces sp. NPDC001407]|uniref:WXG100 family type VII secretion target n=1 Tax=Streptomyces sp. NPDC001407 TaxID=3364573 RepID=UPI00368FB289
MTVTEFNSPLIKPSPANSPLANPADPRRQFPSPFATYDFTSIPHEQLLAMLEPADPKKVTDLAGRLADASTAIKELGVDLKRHMDRVHWQGEGGDAFRDWGSRMSNATLRLSHYAENAGTWMNHAAATLTQVHNQMPKYSTASKATVDAFLKPSRRTCSTSRSRPSTPLPSARLLRRARLTRRRSGCTTTICVRPS